MPVSPSGRRFRCGPVAADRVRNTVSASGNGMLPTKWTIGLCAVAALIAVTSPQPILVRSVQLSVIPVLIEFDLCRRVVTSSPQKARIPGLPHMTFALKSRPALSAGAVLRDGNVVFPTAPYRFRRSGTGKAKTAWSGARSRRVRDRGRSSEPWVGMAPARGPGFHVGSKVVGESRSAGDRGCCQSGEIPHDRRDRRHPLSSIVGLPRRLSSSRPWY